MTKSMAIGVAAAVAFAGAGSARAHHSGYMYSSTPLWLEGSVVGFDHINPHTVITLEERSEDGQVRLWAIEGPAQDQLGRMGSVLDLPEVGDVIEFCVFPYKPVEELSRIFPDADFSQSRSARISDGSSPRFVGGHVVVMPDGKKQLWLPHGLISECIRSSDDPRQSWLDFINSSSRVRQTWCQQMAYEHVRTTAPLKALAEEVDALIDDPCE